MSVPKKETVVTVFSTLRYLKKFIWHNDKRLVLKLSGAALISIVMVMLNIAVPLIFREIINLITTKNVGIWISMLLIAYGLVWAVSNVSSQIRSYLVTNVLEEIVNKFSLYLFNHLHKLSLRFHLERRSGAVSSAISRSYQGIESLVWGLVLFMMPTILEIFLAIVVITYLYGLFYGAMIFALLMLYTIASIVGLEASQKANEIHNDKRTKSQAFMIDSLLNFETVKYFGNQEFEHAECEKVLNSQTQAARTVNKQAITMQLAQSLIIGCGLAFITWFAGTEVLNGTLRTGDFVLINGYILQFVMPLSYIGYIVQQIRKGFVDVSDAIALLELKPEIIDLPTATALKAERISIRFDHVFFHYDPKREILKDISFTVPAGKTVAFVGSTGSGKSTIARLVFRLYDVEKGVIYFNGQDIRTLTQQSLHSLIGIVSQDTVLFNNTLYYNIAYGNPAASKEEVLEAAHRAHLDSFIAQLPAGLETAVGERGLLISGGEKQRIAIARALLKNPSVYIFDEATSALDTRTEKEIQQKIKDLSNKATTLIIAHRLSTIIDADQIVVMHQGTIVERGAHADLLALKGHYATLWHEQSLEASGLQKGSNDLFEGSDLTNVHIQELR